MINRSIYPELEKHLNEKEITLITGARQVGKTTLMQQLKAKLVLENKKVLWFNLDLEKDWKYVETQENLLQKVRLEYPEGYIYVFMDEIQRKENAGLFLKGIYDSNPELKLIISGSGSLELKEKIKESLAGRKRIFELTPVNFYEFSEYKTNYKYSGRMDAFYNTEPDAALSLLYEYLTYGGYPRIVTENNIQEKIRWLDELYQSYIDKDIKILLGIERVDAYASMLKFLSSGIGYILNMNELGSNINISAPTIKNYLWYAEKTFITHLISPFFKNKSKELSKSNMVYFNDLGMRNYMINNMNMQSIKNDTGMIFQNLVYHLLKEKTTHTARTIHYWRTTNQAEVDFVLFDGHNIIPAEVKGKRMIKDEIGRSLYSFCGKYNIKKAYIINFNYENEVIKNNCTFCFIPFWRILNLEI